MKNYPCLQISKNRRLRAFTLAELLIAMSLFALASLSVLGLLFGNFSLQNKSEGQLRAVNQAEIYLDSIKGKPYEEVLALTETPLASREVTHDHITYELTVSAKPLEPLDYNPNEGVLLLTVEVSWRERTQLSQRGALTERESRLRIHSVVSPDGNV